MKDQAEMQRRVAPQVVATILLEPVGAGGGALEIQLLLESIVASVMVIIVKENPNDAVDILCERVKQRINEIKMVNSKPAGNA